jgi:Na+/H+ antiporter NhaD/arsenite permease-like protein
MFLTAKFLTVFVFTAAILLTVFFDSRKTLIVWSAVAVLVLTGALTAGDAAASVDLDVLLLYTGMMFMGEVLLYSRIPDYVATHLASKTNSAAAAMLVICAFTGAVSMFVMNIAAIFIVAPVALSICRKCDIAPVPLFTGMILMANLEGAATLIGDPPSMMLGSLTGLTFNDFFYLGGRPSMFFAVQAGALASLPVLYLYFKRYGHSMPKIEPEPYISLAPTALIVLMIAVLAAGSALNHGIPHFTGLVSCLFGAAAFGWYARHSRCREVGAFLRRLDWHTAVFLVGVLILVGTLSSSGLVEDAAKLIVKFSGNDSFLTFMLLIGVSLFVSAFVLNIPYIAAMLPVTEVIAYQVAVDNHALYFGLLLAGSLGGNITPIGASANIVAMGILKEHGHVSKFMDFVKIGLPHTLVAAAAGAAFIWGVFG